MLPEVSTRNANETGADWSFSKVSNATRESSTRTTKSFLVRLSTYLPCLSVTSTGSITYSAPALSAKVGGSCSGACAWASPGPHPAPRRGSPEPPGALRSVSVSVQRLGSAEEKKHFSPINYKAASPPRIPGRAPVLTYTVLSCRHPRSSSCGRRMRRTSVPSRARPGTSDSASCRSSSRGSLPDEESSRLAAGADDVLGAIRRFGSLEEAVAEFPVVVTTSSLRGRGRVRNLELSELGGFLAAVGNGAATAFVFGPERSGLTEDELARASACLRLPTVPEFPTMNLSHAVAVVLAATRALSGEPVRAEPPAEPLGARRRDRGGHRALGPGARRDRLLRHRTPRAVAARLEAAGRRPAADDARGRDPARGREPDSGER